MIDPWMLFHLVDLMGVFAGAFSGALVARRHGYDITGYWGLALVAGLGGGIIRDVCMQVGPPVVLTEFIYLPTVAVAALAGAMYGSWLDRTLNTPIVCADSIALIVFAASGSLRAINHGFGIWPVVLLGVITAVGGGLIRDVLTGETPKIFCRSELYTFAAVGASVTMVIFELGGATQGMMVVAGLTVGLCLRFGSLRWGWSTWVPR